jgi:hypothetical protein
MTPRLPRGRRPRRRVLLLVGLAATVAFIWFNYQMMPGDEFEDVPTSATWVETPAARASKEALRARQLEGLRLGILPPCGMPTRKRKLPWIPRWVPEQVRTGTDGGWV